jgi:cobalt-zinc-cadmium efflux system protein
MHVHSATPCDCHPSAHKIRQLWIALALISVFAAIELGGGLLSHSLALVAEAGHMVSDALALGVALLATWMAQLPVSGRATFGYRRVEILAALGNGLGLMIVAALIGWEAIGRLQAPPTEILSVPMLVTAIVGLGVNSLNAFLLHGDSHDDLNLRGAFLHMVADAVSSVGVIGAAIAVGLWGWNWADGAISLAVAIFIAIGALPVIRQSCDILLEKTPFHLDVERIQAHLLSFSGVKAVEGLRVWTIALGQEALLAELIVEVRGGEDRDRLLAEMQDSIRREFGVDAVLQMSAPVAVNLSRPGVLMGVSDRGDVI